MFLQHSSTESEMEVELSALFLTFLSMLVLLKFGSKFRSSNSISRLPPGPWKLPFIGNLHNLVGSHPHHVFRDLAKIYGPLMHLQLGEISTVVVSSPETAKEVMKTRDIIFASRPHIIATEIMSYDSTNLVFAPYGEYWRQLRKICTLELLSTRRVQSFRNIRDEETSSLTRWLACNSGSPVNLTEKIHSSSYTNISRTAFGKISAEQETFISALEESLKLAAGFNIADIYPSIKFFHLISGVKPKLERLHMEVDRILGKIINDHRIGSNTNSDDPETRKDIVDVLLKYHDENLDFSLTLDNIKAVLWDMFGAGGETSATTVDWAMSEMIKNPRIMKKAQDEVREVFSGKGYVDEEYFDKLKYLKSVIKETLRLHPPLPLLLPRENSERSEISGYEIPLKTKVIVNAWAINRDPSYWGKDAECFKPERFLDGAIDYKGTNFEYIPFGAGRRICPGMQLGLINIELPLAKILYHFDWNLPGGMKQGALDMTEAFGITVRRKDDLYLIPVLRNPLPIQ